MLQLTRFESNLLRLGTVYNRMYIIFEDFAQLPDKKQFGKTGNWLEYSMKTMVREYAIIQLYNFIKIRKALLGDFAANGKKDLDPCLEPLWGPVLKQRLALERLRNAWYAHVQEDEPFRELLEDILNETDYPSSFGDTLFLVGCVFWYCTEVQANFSAEFRTARNRLKAITPFITAPVLIKDDEVMQHFTKAQTSAIRNLLAAKLQTHFDYSKD